MKKRKTAPKFQSAMTFLSYNFANKASQVEATFREFPFLGSHLIQLSLRSKDRNP